ncbi:hypothetical protein FE840_018665 (plasmid) [Peteryoungia desertarenae]|uniref:Integrase n=1 Tax=Peteryoungia desertarenae TaxID=1813451 RepID=A0ABX6QTZ8_9HYPH|nr:hypothetical protein [Peteryoungia desertarenae]QLF71670.1 hypothetical protein FE840_018665 [Peteryoungia desertarenae]
MRVAQDAHVTVSRPVTNHDDLSTSTSGHPDAHRQGRPGPYLTRSGSVYIFQIRVPRDLAGDVKPSLIRISIGPCLHRRARIVADLLAARARLMFEERRAMALSNEDKENDPPPPSELELATWLGQVKGELEVLSFFFRQPVAPITLEDQSKLAGIRDLVQISQQVEAKDRGEPHAPIVVENAEALRRAAAAKFNVEDAASSVAPNAPFAPAQMEPAPVLGEGKQTSQIAKPVEVEPVASVAGGIEVSAQEPNLTPETKSAALSNTTSLTGQADLPSAQLATHSLSRTEKIPLDKHGMPISLDKLDRRFVYRAPSDVPKFSVVAHQYIQSRIDEHGGYEGRNITTAKMRIQVFLDLIGDHPADRYSGVDLQAFVNLMAHWPGDPDERLENESPFDTLERSKKTNLKPLADKTLREGYVAVVKAALRSGMTKWGYRDPFAGVSLRYSKGHRKSKPTVPLSSVQLNRIFEEGVKSGYIDNTLLPLLGHLTGRRIGLLTYLKGSDIREKFGNVWIAETDGIVEVNGVWERVPYKTGYSLTYFVLHDFLREIGFIDWAKRRGDEFLFPDLMRLKDPAGRASSYMQRLFEKAGIERGRREVFHSLRSGKIDDMRAKKIDDRARKLQVGHALGDDEHSNYGSRVITEDHAFEIAFAPLSERVDYSIFKGLDFDRLALNRRKNGHRKPVVQETETVRKRPAKRRS